jgi:hypothetical protein
LLIANLVSQPAVLQVLMDGRFVLAKRAFQEAHSRLISIIPTTTSAHLHFINLAPGTLLCLTREPKIFCARKTPNWGVCFPVSDTARENSLTPHKALYFSQPDLSTNWPVCFLFGMRAAQMRLLL